MNYATVKRESCSRPWSFCFQLAMMMNQLISTKFNYVSAMSWSCDGDGALLEPSHLRQSSTLSSALRGARGAREESERRDFGACRKTGSALAVAWCALLASGGRRRGKSQGTWWPRSGTGRATEGDTQIQKWKNMIDSLYVSMILYSLNHISTNFNL